MRFVNSFCDFYHKNYKKFALSMFILMIVYFFAPTFSQYLGDNYFMNFSYLVNFLQIDDASALINEGLITTFDAYGYFIIDIIMFVATLVICAIAYFTKNHYALLLNFIPICYVFCMNCYTLHGWISLGMSPSVGYFINLGILLFIICSVICLLTKRYYPKSPKQHSQTKSERIAELEAQVATLTKENDTD